MNYIHPVILAQRFAAQVRLALPPEQLAEANRRNTTTDYANACATHDYLDANELMLVAMECAKVTFAPEDQQQADIMNAAWDIARTVGFDPEKVHEAEEFLCDEYDAWCKANNMPGISADSQEPNDDAQREYLQNFIRRWDALMAALKTVRDYEGNPTYLKPAAADRSAVQAEAARDLTAERITFAKNGAQMMVEALQKANEGAPALLSLHLMPLISQAFNMKAALELIEGALE